MSDLPPKCVVDTNVPITANKSTRPDSISFDMIGCVSNCVKAVKHVMENRALVIDYRGDIFDEYRRHLSFSGQPGIGDAFLKWVHDNQWKSSHVDRVKITKNDDSYNEFPKHDGLASFDKSDRKFVAVANAHADKPPILQATDSKWWGWKKALKEAGIKVNFLCPDYVESRYLEDLES